MKKNDLKPWQRQQWCLPTVGADVVWQMEDGLDLYEQPDDPLRPVVCCDETPYQLIGERLVPIALEAGQPERDDYEYERNGVVNLFMVFQPGAGWRHVSIRTHRCKEDVAHVIKDLVDEQFPQAEEVKIVMDHLNTHPPASLYEVFLPEEARRVAAKLDIHDTPNHASW